MHEGSRFKVVDVFCDGESTLSYNCSAIHNMVRDLTWTITYPGQPPITIEYDENSPLNTARKFGMGITSSFNKMISKESVFDYIESILTFPREAVLNRTQVRCAINILEPVDIQIRHYILQEG